MRGEKHREERKKTWRYQWWGTILPPPWGNCQNSSRDKGVTVEENVLTYWQGVEGAEGWDPAWDLISFKINQPIKWHWSTIFPPSKPPFPVTDTSTSLHTLLIWPLYVPCRPPLFPRLLQHELVYPLCWEGRDFFFPIFASRINTDSLLISPCLTTLILQLWM